MKTFKTFRLDYDKEWSAFFIMIPAQQKCLWDSIESFSTEKECWQWLLEHNYIDSLPEQYQVTK